MMSSNEYQYRIFNIKAVIEITALSRSTIYEMMNPKSKYYDSTFPKPVRLTEIIIEHLGEKFNGEVFYSCNATSKPEQSNLIYLSYLSF